MKLSPHFDSEEFKCKCCGEGAPKKSLLLLLESLHQEITAKYGYCKIVITGPLRCKQRNMQIGGAKKSRHLPAYSDGVDIMCYKKDINNNWEQLTSIQVAALFDRLFPNSFGMGIYHNRNHVDTRPVKSRFKV